MAFSLRRLALLSAFLASAAACGTTKATGAGVPFTVGDEDAPPFADEAFSLEGALPGTPLADAQGQVISLINVGYNPGGDNVQARRREGDTKMTLSGGVLSFTNMESRLETLRLSPVHVSMIVTGIFDTVVDCKGRQKPKKKEPNTRESFSVQSRSQVTLYGGEGFPQFSFIPDGLENPVTVSMKYHRECSFWPAVPAKSAALRLE